MPTITIQPQGCGTPVFEYWCWWPIQESPPWINQNNEVQTTSAEVPYYHANISVVVTVVGNSFQDTGGLWILSYVVNVDLQLSTCTVGTLTPTTLGPDFYYYYIDGQ